MKKKSENAASAGVDTNIWSPIIRGVIVIVLGVGSFILWAVQAPLDAGVVADGTVTVSSNRKTIQHLSGGRVTDIFIKEGDFVKMPYFAILPVTLCSKSSNICFSGSLSFIILLVFKIV